METAMITLKLADSCLYKQLSRHILGVFYLRNYEICSFFPHFPTASMPVTHIVYTLIWHLGNIATLLPT